MTKTKLAGALLRIERIRQNKGQKEVCYGICVPSYLSKIEHGTVNPDEEIVKQLFSKMNITYYCDEVVLKELKQKIEQYFKCLNYAYKTKDVYDELIQQKQVLEYSELIVDWLLIRGFEGENVLKELETLENYMEQRQKAYFNLLRFRNTPNSKDAEEWCIMATQILNHSFSYAGLLECYFWNDNYTAIHQLENRITAIALEEGNTYYLANYYFMKGSCLCLSYHKLGLAYIRKGEVEKGKEFLEKMKKRMEEECPENEAEILRYQEACMECEENYLDNPEYLELLEKLEKSLKKNYSFGHLYFYKDMIMEAYKRQRKYKKALEFEEQISSKIKKSYA